MFGRGLGGIEQAFVDYCLALTKTGNKVTALLHPKAAIEKILTEKCGNNLQIIKTGNLGQWDFFAVLKLKKILKKLHPDAIITHGNRATVLLKKAAGSKFPVIGVAHNYSIKKLTGLAGVFTITKQLRDLVIKAGQPAEKTFHIPNMIDCSAISPNHAANTPPIIGTMGRFVKKKGFDNFLFALKELNNRNVNFRAVIGGGGEEEKKLKELREQLQLNDLVEFPGWVADKNNFFCNIDIFCLPSLHEPFGIVLLEAFCYGVPTVTTDSEGPSEIATNNVDALVAEKTDIAAMAGALEELLKNPEKARMLAENARNTVKEKYDIKIVGGLIAQALDKITSQRI